jgi:hypothetical protein
MLIRRIKGGAIVPYNPDEVNAPGEMEVNNGGVPYYESELDLTGGISYDTWHSIHSEMVFIGMRESRMRERQGANFQLNYRRLNNTEINALSEQEGRAYLRYLMLIRRGDEGNALNQLNRFMRNNPPPARNAV